MIVLGLPVEQASADSTMSKYLHHPVYSIGPYVLSEHPSTLPYVPSPFYFYIRVLAFMPDQVHKLGQLTLKYSSRNDESSFDIIRSLIPSFGAPDFSISSVDPRLWATLAQLYKTSLPDAFSHYNMPLSDAYLPLLQTIPSTPAFSLVTILELPGCVELDDNSILELRALHMLVALEASGTNITDYGIRTLAKTLVWDDDSNRRGPWPLRILRLRNCKGVTANVLPSVAKFPLLSVLDLRGTKCWSSCAKASPWTLSTYHDLYHPTPLRASLSLLKTLADDTLFSSSTHFHVCISCLQYSRPYERDLGIKRETITRRKSKFSNVMSRDTVTLVSNNIDSGVESASPANRGSTWLETVVQNEMESVLQKQAVNAFYAKLPNIRQPTMSTSERIYVTQETCFRSSGNEKAMFFRQPPPWSDLELQKPLAMNRVAAAKRSVETLTIHKNSEKARLMAAWQTSFMTKPKEKVLSAPLQKLEDTLKGGNPFRRKSEPQALPASLLGANKLRAEGTTTKHVRPISSLDVPALPEAEKKKLKDVSRRESLPSSTSEKARSSGPPLAKKAKFDMEGWLKPKKNPKE